MSEDLIQEIIQRLVATFQPEQVILFGSHAWGSPTPDSDVDLMVIVADSDLTAYQRAVLGHRSLSGLGVAKISSSEPVQNLTSGKRPAPR